MRARGRLTPGVTRRAQRFDRGALHGGPGAKRSAACRRRAAPRKYAAFKKCHKLLWGGVLWLYPAFTLKSEAFVYHMKNTQTLCLALLLCALSSSAHASAGRHVRARGGAAGARVMPNVALRLDYAGAEALINALERDALSDADVDDLLRVPGLRAMVDNVTRFIPNIGVPEFRKEIRAFVRAKKGGEYNDYFQLSDVWRERSRVRTLTTAIRADERKIVGETLSLLGRYRPDTGPLPITVYFVAGGVSTGFAFENDPKAFYANLTRAGGDLNGVVLNMAHEGYHVMQFTAQKRAGINPLWVSNEKMPPAERLFTATLQEGTANYVADPTRWAATGPDVESARLRYRRNAEPARVAQNFALFDAVLKELREGRITWEVAYKKGFTSDNDDSFYFVGYEMAKALERYCGRGCIGRLFAEPPAEFFRRYIALYRRHPEIRGRFSRETETFIEAYGTKPGR